MTKTLKREFCTAVLQDIKKQYIGITQVLLITQGLYKLQGDKKRARLTGRQEPSSSPALSQPMQCQTLLIFGFPMLIFFCFTNCERSIWFDDTLIPSSQQSAMVGYKVNVLLLDETKIIILLKNYDTDIKITAICIFIFVYPLFFLIYHIRILYPTIWICN